MALPSRTRPLWSRDGRELFYLDGQGRMMAVALQRGSTFAAGNPRVIFGGPYLAAPGRTYDVSPDGQRFLMIKAGGGGADETASPASLVVVQHWTEELNRLVPTN
jgi:eukaryotic-like serine/threonine-protein kinase